MTNLITPTWRRPGPKNRIFAFSDLETVVFIVEQCFWAHSNRLEELGITCYMTRNPKSNMAASRVRKPILSFYGHNFLPNWASSILRRHFWKSIEFCIENVIFTFSIGCIDYRGICKNNAYIRLPLVWIDRNGQIAPELCFIWVWL